MKRPDDVPAAAKYNEQDGYWREGDASAPVERLWADGGNPMLVAPRTNGTLHGEVRWKPAVSDTEQYASRVAIATSLGLPTGPVDGVIATYEHGVLVKAVFTLGVFDDMDGWFKPEVVAELPGGKLTTLEWKVGSTNGEPIFAHGDLRLEPGTFKLPKPWPAKMVATFANGKRVETTFFDDKGKPLKAADTAIKDWGETTKPKEIAGYIERGDFLADTKKFFPNAEPFDASELPKKLDKLAKLPAARALHSAVRTKKLPAMGVAFDLSSFGTDCATIGLAGASDPKYVAVASTGSGDLFLLDTSTGKVIPYFHEGDEFDLKHAYESLDAFVFALLRIEAAARKLIPKAALSKALGALGIKAGVATLKQF